MSIEALVQLRAMRDKIADSLRTDPRYLTVSALDRSIVEISNVLKSFESTSAATPPISAPPISAPPAAPK